MTNLALFSCDWPTKFIVFFPHDQSMNFANYYYFFLDWLTNFVVFYHDRLTNFAIPPPRTTEEFDDFFPRRTEDFFFSPSATKGWILLYFPATKWCIFFCSLVEKLMGFLFHTTDWRISKFSRQPIDEYCNIFPATEWQNLRFFPHNQLANFPIFFLWSIKVTLSIRKKQNSNTKNETTTKKKTQLEHNHPCYMSNIWCNQVLYT